MCMSDGWFDPLVDKVLTNIFQLLLCTGFYLYLVILINMCVIPFMFLCITICVESHSTPAMGWGSPMATGPTSRQNGRNLKLQEYHCNLFYN